MGMTVSEMAKMAGISVRTLHYYDEIGLLKPAALTDAGYRIYDDEAMSTLEQILFFRELGFPLSEIKHILSNPEYDKIEALKKHRELLLLKQEHIQSLLRNVDKAIGGKNMKNNRTTTAEIEAAKAKYADEVREKWGNTKEYEQSVKKSAGRSAGSELAIAEEADEILAGFAASMDKDCSSVEVQSLVKRWQTHISAHYYECSKEMLKGLGAMYVCDERFTKNIDRFGDGTAKFMSDAINCYCE